MANSTTTTDRNETTGEGDSVNPAPSLQNPDEWKSADDRMTEPQRIYLDTLSREAGESTPDDGLSKAEASKKIDELRDEADVEDHNPDFDTEDEPDINHEP